MEQEAAMAVGNLIGLAILIGICICVFVDAKNIGDDHGRLPGAVTTKPGYWAVAVFALLIVALPLYLVARVRYKKLLAKRIAAANLRNLEAAANALPQPGTWPPPPSPPAT